MGVNMLIDASNCIVIMSPLPVALMVPVAVEYMRDGGDPDWNEFRCGLVQRTLTACDELACQQLLSIHT